MVCAGLLLSAAYPVEVKAFSPQAETGKSIREYNKGDKKTVKSTNQTREKNERQTNREQRRMQRAEERQQRKMDKQARKENRRGYDRNDLGDVYKGL